MSTANWNEKTDTLQITHEKQSLFLDGDSFEDLIHELNFLWAKREAAYADSNYTRHGFDPEQFADDEESAWQTEEQEWKDTFNEYREEFE